MKMQASCGVYRERSQKRVLGEETKDSGSGVLLLIDTAEEESVETGDMLISRPSKYAVSLAGFKEERVWHYLRQQEQLDQKGYDEKDNKKGDLIYLT